jgi:hypothetical protein
LGLAPFITWLLLQAAITDTVAVESEPRAPELEQVLLDGCSAALGAADRCRSASAAQPNPAPPTWFVRVEWSEDGKHARIAFRLHDAAGELTELRDVSFAEGDSAEQRSKAVGLIVAAYVVQQAEARAQDAQRKAAGAQPEPPAESGSDSDSDSDSGSDSDSDSGSDSDSERRVPPVWGLDLALYGGPGLQHGAPRFGLLARGLAWPLSLPIAGVVGVRAAERFEQPELRWLSGTLGLAASLLPPQAPGGLELRAEAAAQNVRATAKQPAGTAREHDDVWRFGGFVGLDGWVELGAGFALLGGMELALFRPRVHLEIQGNEVGLDPAVSWSGAFGVRYTR